MFETYSVSADNCNSPSITYGVKNLSAKSALFLANHLAEGFRKVEVICEQTGELVFSVYYNDDFKSTTLSELACLSIVHNTFKE